MKTKPTWISLTICLIIMGLSGLNYSLGQQNMPIGTWRTHLPYNRAQLVEVSDYRVFCAGNNSLFYYDQEDLSLHKLTKSDGFSDVGISAMAYDRDRKITLFGYSNGNLDILDENIITNYNAIKKLSVLYEKSILDIDYHSDYAYLTTVFGIFVLNLDITETKEVYRNLGPEGQHLDLYGAEILRDTIFLVTGSGVMAGSLNPLINLMDFRNWHRYDDDDGIPIMAGTDVASDGMDLYALLNNEQIYVYRNGGWMYEDIQLDGTVFSISGTDAGILITTDSDIYAYQLPGAPQLIEKGPSNNPQMTIMDSNDIIWIADGLNGLITDYNGPVESYSPSGPFTDQVFRITYGSGSIIAVPGGYTTDFQPLQNNEGFSVYKDGFWMNYNNSGMAGSIPIADIKDLTNAIAYNDNFVFASYGGGLMDFSLPDAYEVTDAETVGATLNFSGLYDSLTLVTTILNDLEGNEWLINYDTDYPLQKRDAEGLWTSYSIPEFPGSKYVLDLIIPYTNDKWLRMNPFYGGGILIHNEESAESRYLSTENGNGGLPSNIINDMIEDKDGQIWMATAKGVAFYPSSIGILSNGSVDAHKPVFDGRYLLYKEYITTIELDGGNRKWIGTRKGVWLFSEDGSRLIENFNTENSPIPSDNIIDIGINPQNGEVFFATDMGLVSYRGDATEAGEIHTDVKIFPNPVTPDFTGLVGIEGLARDAIVKITDISGKKIWEVRASGGTATWNVSDYMGNRAATGVYLVFSSTSDGKETFVGKIAVIN